MMTLAIRRLTLAAVLSLAAAVCPQPSNPQTGNTSSAQQPPTAAPDEATIQKRDTASNGIWVGTPKIYDDSLLQKMLNDAQARLGALQVLDQSSLVNRLGAVSGAALNTSSLGVSVQGGPSPQLTVTSAGPTGSTVATTTTGATSSSSTTQTAGLPTRNITSVNPSITVPSANAPPPTASLPSSFAVSASNLLNEQMQLTYEIANLRLLLEGSLSDRVIQGTTIVKPRITVGFPISVSPQKSYKNAVAVVEVEIEVKFSDKLGQNEQVAITALLPREKTYNVASITDRNTSLGGGMVMGAMAGASIAWGFSHKTYYLVQDQDTVAETFTPSEADGVGFRWEFRPVLGQDYLQSGLKQTFVQLAFPVLRDAKTFGTAVIRTYWRKYDRKHNVVLGVINGSSRAVVKWEIPNVPLPLEPKAFGVGNVEDLGNGSLLVNVQGPFLSGTAVRIGSVLLGQGSPGFTYDLYRIRFVAPVSDLATKATMLVGRDGSERLLLLDQSFSDPNNAPQIAGVKVSSVDDSNSLVTIELARAPDPGFPLLIVIGDRAFGYSDAPVERSGNKLSAVVPTALLTANRRVMVTSILAGPRYRAGMAVADIDVYSQPEHLVLLEVGEKSSKFLLFGSRLGDAQIVYPASVQLQNLGRLEDANSVRLLELTTDQIKNVKEVLLQRRQERPIPIPIPAVSRAATPAGSLLTAKERVTVGSDEAVIVGDGLNGLQNASFRGIPIRIEKLPGGASVRLTGLKSAGVTTNAGTQSLDLKFANSKATVNLEVVSAKVETVAK